MDNQLFRDIQTDLDLNGPILSFTTQPTSLQVAGVGPGQTGGPTATFTTVATVSFPGDPTPINSGTIGYQWYGPLGVLTEGTKYVGTKTTTLQITNVTSPTDVGSYYAVVDYVPSDQTGNAVNEPLNSDSAELTSFPVIEINAQPTPFTNIPSQDSNFNINASLSNNGIDLSYQWQLDGEDVNDGTVTKSTIEQVPGTTDYRVTRSGVVGHMRSFDIPAGAKEVLFEIAGGSGGSGGGNYPDGMGTAGRGGYGMQGWFRLAKRHYMDDDYSKGLRHVVHVDLIAGGKGSDGVVGSRDAAPGGQSTNSADGGGTGSDGSGGPGGPAGWGANGGEQSSGDAGGGGGGGAASWIQIDNNIAITAGGGGGGGGAWFGNTAGGNGQNGRDAGPRRSAAQNADGKFNPLTLSWEEMPGDPSVHQGNNGAGGHNGTGTDTPGGGGGGGGKNGGPGGWHGHRPNGGDCGHEGSSAYKHGDVDYRSGSYNINSDGYAFVHYLVTGEPTLIDQNVTRTTTISGSSTSQLTLNTDGPGIGYTVRCDLTSSSASNSPYASDVVDYHVESTVESADIVVEGIGLNLSTASVSTIDLSNGELSLDTIGKGFVGTAPAIQLYSLHAPDRDVDIEMDLYGGGAPDASAGEGGFARIRFTMKQNEEYVIAGLTDNVNTPFLYRKSTLIACVGEAGRSGVVGQRGGNGGGINMSGADAGPGGGQGGRYNGGPGGLTNTGIFGGAYTAPFLYPGDQQRGNNTGGFACACAKGVYWAQQGLSPCADIPGDTQFRLSDGTEVTNTASIARGYKAGYNVIQTAGGGQSRGFRGGNGAKGGNCGTGGGGNSGGGGGSGYSDLSVTVVHTTQGGSTEDAKVIIRVAT